MKLFIQLLLGVGVLLMCVGHSKGQSYEVLDYHMNSTPVNGVKIKTNLPFTDRSQMVTLRIEGYSYGKRATLGVNLAWYIYDGGFFNTNISSWGNDTPPISLANEANKVVIFIHDKVYYQRFKITAFAKGMAEVPTWFQGWTAVDQVLSGTQIVNLTYKNTVGDLYANGNVGIGTTAPQAKLAVNGNILAKEIKIKTDISVPDYVFEPDYDLATLSEVEAHIREHKHLPEIPSAKDIQRDGLDLAEMNLLLLKKVEELTLHLIEREKAERQIIAELAALKRQVAADQPEQCQHGINQPSIPINK